MITSWTPSPVGNLDDGYAFGAERGKGKTGKLLTRTIM